MRTRSEIILGLLLAAAMLWVAGCQARGEWKGVTVEAFDPNGQAVSLGSILITTESQPPHRFGLQLDEYGRGRLLIPENQRAAELLARAQGVR